MVPRSARRWGSQSARAPLRRPAAAASSLYGGLRRRESSTGCDGTLHDHLVDHLSIQDPDGSLCIPHCETTQRPSLHKAGPHELCRWLARLIRDGEVGVIKDNPTTHVILVVPEPC